MSEAARVTSVEAVQRFYAAVRVFQDEAEAALLTMDQQLAKVLSWYDYDGPHYWKEQVRRSFDEVARARVAYETCRMRVVADHRPSCYEEKEALHAAKRRLEYCQDQVDVVAKWANRLHRVIDEFRAHSGRFQQHLQTDMEKTANLLARTVTSLESYLGHSLQSEGSPAPPAEPNEVTKSQPKD
jgi:hypothetical protein